MGHFADSFGLVLSRKMSITFNHLDFFPAAQFLQRSDVNPSHRQPRSKRMPQDVR